MPAVPRSGNRLDHKDNRTRALLHLVEQLPRLARPPRRILVENVIGFEHSESRRRLLAALAAMGWEAAEFGLDALDFGLPNRRPRYYGLFRPAWSAAEAEAHQAGGGWPPRWRPASEALADEGPAVLQGPLVPPPQVPPLGEFLVAPEELELEEAELGVPLEVPQETMSKRLDKDGRYDIHLRSDRTSACLTKVNGRLPRGFSPLVLMDEEATGPLEQRPKLSVQGGGPGAATDHIWKEGVRVRYLSPREQLRLMGYPDSFRFPPSATFKERAGLVGNSLNVKVVAWLLKILLDDGPPAVPKDA